LALLNPNILQIKTDNPTNNYQNPQITVNLNDPTLSPNPIVYSTHLVSQNDYAQLTSSTYAGRVVYGLTGATVIISAILYMLGHRHNHILSFLQLVSFLRFCINNPSWTKFSFLHNLQPAYFYFGHVALQDALPANYYEYSEGNFTWADVDANIIRNVSLPIIFTMVLFFVFIIRMIFMAKT
jgi:hypothetical protein